MFILRKNPLVTATAQAAAEPVKEARQRLADASEGLTFETEAHRYTYAGGQLRSVSSIVEHYAPFDTLAMAKKCAANPKHPYYGKEVEEIVALWELKRDNAADAGTKLHSFGEACYLFMHGREDEMEPEWRERISEGGLVAVEPKEVALARWWAENDWGRYAVVAKETRVMNPALRYAGTFDLLLYDLQDPGYLIKDYKSNEDLYKNYGDRLRPPLNIKGLYANDIGKYTVQQTLYGICIANIGLRLLGAELVWLREEEYENVPLDMRYDKLVAYAASQLNTQIK